VQEVITERPGARAGLYLRISQDKEGLALGVQRQEEDCRALCERRGWSVAAVYSDNDTSAFNTRKKRPGFDALIEAAQAKQFDVIVCYSTSRLYRRLRDLEDIITKLDAAKVEVATAVAGDLDFSTAAGRRNARIMGSIAMGESEEMGERLQRKFLDSAQKGRRHGGNRQFGYDRADGTYVINDHEAEVIRWCANQLLNNGIRIGTLMRLLREKGEKTPKGNDWTWYGLRRMLISPVLIGKREHWTNEARRNGGEPTLYDAPWQPILTAKQHYQLKALLTPEIDPKRRNRIRSTSPLSGLLYCGVCGARLVYHSGVQRHSRRARDASSFRCPDEPQGHQCVQVNEVPLYRHVGDEVRVKLSTMVIGKAGDREAPDVTEEDDPEVAEIAELQQRLDDLAQEFAHGDLSATAYTRATSVIENQKADAERRMATRVKIEAAKPDVTDWGWIEPERLQTLLESPVTELDLIESEDVSVAFRGLIDKVLVKKATGTRSPVSERVEIFWREP
jgi:site-specific DNA recombinase